MGVEKDGSRPGGYVGGFFQLFDWKAKSRKKLFSSKSESQERSKQVKKHDGNLPMTQIYMMEEDEIGIATSVKGHSDYSCSSSVTDDDGYGSRAPNVVARLMGLDSMPTTNSSEPYSSPFFDGLSIRSDHYQQRNREHRKMHSVDMLNDVDVLMKDHVEPKSQRTTVHRPIEKFQTEILPPRSAKSIPITHHKLLSPIKSPGFIPSKNAAHIMEAAARIIEPGPAVPFKAKTSLVVGSPSVHLKVRDLKEKVEATQRLPVFGSSIEDLRGQDIKEKMDIDQKTVRPLETSRRTVESSASRYLKGQPVDKSWNGMDTSSSRASSSTMPEISGVKNKGKSISLAIQAKVNVQRREGLSSSSGRSSVSQQEVSENKSSQHFRSQLHAQRSSQKKPLSSNSSGVLRQNNQKQNCLLDKQKLPPKNLGSSSQGRKLPSDSSSGREKTVKSVGNSKTTRKLDAIDNDSEALRSNVKRSLRKKRSIDPDFQFEKNWAVSSGSSEKNKKPVQQPNAILEKNYSWGESSRKKGMDVVSFTFTTPLARQMSDGETSAHATPDKRLCSDHYGKRSLSSLDTVKSSSLQYNFIGGDALSLLLEQKLKEFTLDSASSHSDPASTSSCTSTSQDLVQPLNFESSASIMHGKYKQNVLPKDRLHAQYETDLFTPDPPLSRLKQDHHQGIEVEGSNSNSLDAKLYFDSHNPSPISTLAPVQSIESCISSDSTDSNNMEGYRQSLSVQAQEILDMNNSGKSSSAMDLDLTDSATSGCNNAKSYNPTDLSMTFEGELEYVKEILSNVELMFKDYSLGRVREIITPHLFEQLETRKGVAEYDGGESLQRKLLFDCTRECLESRCRKYIGGGCRTWTKGLAIVRRKERLAEDVYKEISGWKGMGDCMVDDLVDKDMSCQYGRWLDFEADGFELGVDIEAEILAGLVDEALADILRV